MSINTCVSRHSNALGGASCRPVVSQSLVPPTVPQSAICLRVYTYRWQYREDQCCSVSLHIHVATFPGTSLPPTQGKEGRERGQCPVCNRAEQWNRRNIASYPDLPPQLQVVDHRIDG